MTLSRRQFLRAACGSCAAAAAGALPACAPAYEPAPSLDVAAPVDQRITVALAAAPALARDGGAVIVRSPGAPEILLVRVPGTGTYAATSARCTHQGCPLGVDGEEIVCPCHLSRFGFDGAVRHRPARADLPLFQAALDPGAEAVIIDLAAGDAGFPEVVAGAVRLAFADFPALLTPGESITGRPRGYGRPIVVAALPAGGFAAVDAVCPHLACTVAFAAGPSELVCPCHGSRFAADGALLAGPATRPLLAFEVTADAEGVTVTIPAG